MKIAAKIYAVIARALAICALITFAMLLFARVLDVPNTDAPSITLSRFLQILAFSVPLSLAHELFALRRLPFIARLAFHYASVTLFFTLLFVVVGKIASRPFAVLIWIFVFTLLYAVIAGIVFPILRATGYYAKYLARIDRTGEDSQPPYEKRFS